MDEVLIALSMGAAPAPMVQSCPDSLAARVGGGSNVMGIFSAYIEDPNMALYAVGPFGGGELLPRPLGGREDRVVPLRKTLLQVGKEAAGAFQLIGDRRKHVPRLGTRRSFKGNLLPEQDHCGAREKVFTRRTEGVSPGGGRPPGE